MLIIFKYFVFSLLNVYFLFCREGLEKMEREKLKEEEKERELKEKELLLQNDVRRKKKFLKSLKEKNAQRVVSLVQFNFILF